MKLETPETWETQIALKGWFKIIHILFSHSNKETKVERILLKGLYSTKVFSCRITRFQHCFFFFFFLDGSQKRIRIIVVFVWKLLNAVFLRTGQQVQFVKRPVQSIFLQSTPITKPFFTSDQNEEKHLYQNQVFLIRFRKINF